MHDCKYEIPPVVDVNSFRTSSNRDDTINVLDDKDEGSSEMARTCVYGLDLMTELATDPKIPPVKRALRAMEGDGCDPRCDDL
jgi:hypothetical protein